MTDTLSHKGYIGSIEHDLEAGVLYGKVMFLADSVYYQGSTLPELKKCFENAIDEYIETCEGIGKEPEKPFTGSFNVRMSSDLHKKLAYRAAEDGCKLNAVVVLACEQFVDANRQRKVIHNHTHEHVSYFYHFDMEGQGVQSTSPYSVTRPYLIHSSEGASKRGGKETMVQ
ncbi:MAG: type II toxin-antitoxin system HicB family antitoxin [Pseudomonadales bacterium]|nr:type II toxin-antitoxin system HicB family antitoxin [Pseudomonadales bacterium]